MDKLTELKEQRQRLEERIKELESELKKPSSKDPEEDAVDEQNREILYRLYLMEKENLVRVDAETKELNQ